MMSHVVMTSVLRFGVMAIGAISLVIFVLRLYDWATYADDERSWDEARGYQRRFDLPLPGVTAAFALLLAWMI